MKSRGIVGVKLCGERWFGSDARGREVEAEIQHLLDAAAAAKQRNDLDAAHEILTEAVGLCSVEATYDDATKTDSKMKSGSTTALSDESNTPVVIMNELSKVGSLKSTEACFELGKVKLELRERELTRQQRASDRAFSRGDFKLHEQYEEEIKAQPRMDVMAALRVLRSIRQLQKANRQRLKDGLPPVTLSTDKSRREQEARDSARNVPSEEDAFEWLMVAAQAGHSSAMVLAANMLVRSGDTVEEAAVDLYRRAADLGQADACFNLGLLYYEGRVPGEPDAQHKAVEHFHRAAELGDVAAEFWLGHAYRAGECGVAVDEDKSLRLLESAASKGHPHAQFYLAQVYRDADAERADEYLQQAVDNEWPDALYTLGTMLVHGEHGREVDFVQARKLFTRAGDLQHGDALCALGAMYFNGLGVERNAHKAFVMYNRASELNNVTAWHNLADMYARGVGVEKNEAAAAHFKKLVDKYGDGM